ncbi:G2/M phase-specific E3 ubiquitin-protein ligase, partial [Chaetura pelagica]
CMLCRREDADPDICGSTVERNGICAHEFCLRFAKRLCDQRSDTEAVMIFFVTDVRCMIEQAAQKHCFVCGESGASITCWEMDCDRSFHLPCAVEGECVTQFVAPYRAFCWEHRPQQAVEETPEDNNICLICLDPVGDKKSYSTLVCPACKHAWFHRGCLQGQAMSNGFTCFQCLICRDKDVFRPEMCTLGIRIPLSLPSWDSQAFAELNARHSRCDAWECFCLGGREQVEEEGPWQLLLCSSCAAEGTHRFCSNLTNSTSSWECDSC